ncbi:insertion element IS2 transposase InsD [Klebsiella pneumoniae]|uniref:Insertion element IS2 transposase InsD n=1 Tax=Klebsiella pneumoniae TaxID=573 RepID=A0A377XBU4_KLEPN|nr:insertion element IS2 transposase InsD [Klebsiella pneumoniae]
MAESFVKTMQRDYISIMPKPDGLTAVKNLAEAFEHYNEWHPHSALGYRSPREYLRRRTSNGLSDKKCMEMGLPRSWWEGSERHIQFPVVEHHSQLKTLPVAVSPGFYSQQPDLAVQCLCISV